MTFVLKDRIKVTSTTVGTGTFTLGLAAAGYQDFSGIGNGNQTYYTITNGTDWEVGIGTYTSSGTTLARNQVLASSNSNALVDWAAGSKDVYVPQPAENVQGSAPTGDNSSIGTDQVAFDNFQKNLQASVNGGVTFSNNGVAGIGSTYTLAYTTVPRAYAGGVLNSNGEIHFVPYNASVGEKINTITGVVSTYSLVSAQNYFGGVLAPNGDIHFIPEGALRGQKVSLSGLVSTYSIIYLGISDAYRGGVVGPDGSIHFIPHNATVGQKVSTAGVASTYSLVYTTAQAYLGGVLAPNGDIHFVPYSANRGQKISAAGVVSTYSLVYTKGIAYSGGVLSPNGDIHFINYSANVGQKISSAGVISTYSLVYTAGGGAYQGGVLAPNGDIHFVPFGANRGQKISSLGVVSTYSLASTSTSTTQYWGGVLAPNGEIHFVPYFETGETQRGQKISINPAIPFGIDTCLSSYLNKF